MSRALVVDRTSAGIRIGLLEDGRLLEVDVVPQSGAGLGAVCLGRVRTVAHDLDGAFVDGGLGTDAFLGARDARALSGAPRSAPIGQQVSEGQALLVQVRREAEQGKGPRVTTDIALVGIAVVHRPRSGRIEPAPEVAGSDGAEKQQARGASLFPDGGFTLRPAAAHASDQDLLGEAERLRRRWAALEARAGATRPPTVLEVPDPLQRALLEWIGPDLERILFAERTLLIRTRRWLEACLPRALAPLLDRLDHLPDAFEASGAAEQLAEALGAEVALAGGGSVLIEETAALTAIDVNSGGGGTGRPLDVDLAAASEIARQLRLRRIGGIVVIDFVDLASKRERARLDAALREAFTADPAAVQLYPMSPLGLVELSRKRTGPSLAARLGRTVSLAETSDE